MLYNADQMKLVKEARQHREEQALLDNGISYAYEDGQLATIGNADCDYCNYKEFIVHQVLTLGANRYCSITDWDRLELEQDLADVEDPNDPVWSDDIENYFNGGIAD